MTKRSAEFDQRARDLGAITDRLPETIQRDVYTPALLGLLNNLLVWGGSRVFRSVHGVGTNEWRILSALGNHPGATAAELCDVLGLNKSIASTSVNLLLERGLVVPVDGPRGSRYLYLTPEGADVHDDFMPIALRRQAILTSALSDEEVAQLNSLLVRMLDSSSSLQEYERAILAQRSASGTAATHSAARTRSRPKATPGT